MNMIKKRITVLLLAVCLLFCAMTAVYAAGGDPMDVHWDGMTGRWIAPAKPVSYYMVALNLNGGYLSDYTTGDTYYNFTDTIKNCGPGDYTFEVCAVFDDTSKSKTVSSGVYTYNEVKAHPHPLHYVAFRYPTCTEDGVKEHFECPVCDAYYWDAMAQNEIYDKSEVVLPATGHVWGEWQVTKQATETAEGEEKRVCQENSQHVETRKIPKLTPTTSATTAPVTTTPETTAEAETEIATEAGAVVTHSTYPDTTRRDPLDGGPGDYRNNVGLIIALVLGGLLLFLVLPLIIILIIVLSKKNKNRRPPQPPLGGGESRNGSEYLPQPPYRGNQGYPQQAPYPDDPGYPQQPPYPGDRSIYSSGRTQHFGDRRETGGYHYQMNDQDIRTEKLDRDPTDRPDRYGR